MLTRLFLVYLVAELAVLVALVSMIGFGWTALLLLATYAAGVALAGSQLARRLTALRAGAGARRNPQDAVTDGALTALGTAMVIVPGLVSTVAGLLVLMPATRAAARPVLATLVVGRLGRYASLVTVTTAGARQYRRYRQQRDDFIDAEVLDVTDITDTETPALPLRP
jgi:UPF0716 protein FxsA